MNDCCEAGLDSAIVSPSKIIPLHKIDIKHQKICRDLKNIGIDIGLLFQITDDLIDYRGNSIAAGKPTKVDEKKGKATLVRLLGYKKTINLAKKIKEALVKKIKKYGNRSNDLIDSVEFILNRNF